MHARLVLLAIASLACCVGVSTHSISPTSSGFLNVDDSEMFHVFFEAHESPGTQHDMPIDTPIVLWLQGGPGCSSLFGMLYINGPYFINQHDLTLQKNLGTSKSMYTLKSPATPNVLAAIHLDPPCRHTGLIPSVPSPGSIP